MRFRPRIGSPAPWQIYAALSVWFVYLVLQLVRPNNPQRLLVVLIGVFVGLALAAVLFAIRSVYWDITPDCLIVKKLWRKREIPWSEITRGGWLGGMSGTLSISVGHRIEDYDRIYIEIESSSHAAFIAQLRKFVPQAAFELI